MSPSLSSFSRPPQRLPANFSSFSSRRKWESLPKEAEAERVPTGHTLKRTPRRRPSKNLERAFEGRFLTEQDLKGMDRDRELRFGILTLTRIDPFVAPTAVVEPTTVGASSDLYSSSPKFHVSAPEILAPPNLSPRALATPRRVSPQCAPSLECILEDTPLQSTTTLPSVRAPAFDPWSPQSGLDSLTEEEKEDWNDEELEFSQHSPSNCAGNVDKQEENPFNQPPHSRDDSDAERISSLEHKLSKARLEIHHLRQRLYKLEMLRQQTIHGPHTPPRMPGDIIEEPEPELPLTADAPPTWGQGSHNIYEPAHTLNLRYHTPSRTSNSPYTPESSIRKVRKGFRKPVPSP